MVDILDFCLRNATDNPTKEKEIPQGTSTIKELNDIEKSGKPQKKRRRLEYTQVNKYTNVDLTKCIPYTYTGTGIESDTDTDSNVDLYADIDVDGLQPQQMRQSKKRKKYAPPVTDNDTRKTNALHEYAIEKHGNSRVQIKESVTKLIKNNPEYLNAQDTNGNTPLHLAVKFEKITVASALLENRADVNIRNNAGKTSYKFALKKVRSALKEKYPTIFKKTLKKTSS